MRDLSIEVEVFDLNLEPAGFNFNALHPDTAEPKSNSKGIMDTAPFARIRRCGAFLLLFFALINVIAPASQAADGEFAERNLRKSNVIAAKKRQEKDGEVVTVVASTYGRTLAVSRQTDWPRVVHAGIVAQHSRVSVKCFKPKLIGLLRQVERHYGKKPIITSGYRSPAHNRRVRGARRSLHMSCTAADIQVPGVGKASLARYVRSLPGRGGVGLYCRSRSIHIDIGSKRQWYWGCGKKKSRKRS
jgi:hypothetical protein